VVLIYSATIFLIECIYVAIEVLGQKAVERFGPDYDFIDTVITIWEEPLLVLFLLYCLFLMLAVLLLSPYLPNQAEDG